MEQVGRYRLLEQIGRTDVASIHRAYEVTGGGLVRPVTLKRMLPDHAHRFEHDAVLVEEARIAEQLDHPNVIRVVDLDQVDGVWFSVEERIEGRDLGTLLAKARQRGQKIDHDAALFIAIQILQGLAHAHGRAGANGRPLGLVHRDVSPQNVWIGYDGEVRIGGFGYAQLEGRPHPGQPGLDRPRYTYLSPELALGSTADHRSDIFGVGLILWELVAGRPAYEANADSDLSAKTRRGAVPGIRAIAPDASAEIHEAIEKATTFNRDQRPASAQLFRDELARILFKREPTYGPAQLASLVARILADEAAEDRRKDNEARALLKGRSLPSFKTPASLEPQPVEPARPPETPPKLAAAPMIRHAPEPFHRSSALELPSSSLEPFHRSSALGLPSSSLEPFHRSSALGLPSSSLEPLPEPEPVRAIEPVRGSEPEPLPELEPEPEEIEPEGDADDGAEEDAFDYAPPIDAPLPDAPQPPPPSFPAPAADLGDSRSSIGKIAAGVAVLTLVTVGVFAMSSESNMRLVQRKAREAVLGRKAGGSLTIDSLPTGAAVFFDDDPTGKTTPITIENVESQVVHAIRLELEGEKPVTATVALDANAKQSISLMFKEAIVDLRVKVDPPGAEIFRNGRSVALAPATLPVRAGEPFKLAIKKVGYKTFEQELTPERGKPLDVDAKLEKTEELLEAEAAEEEALKAEAKGKKPPVKKTIKKKKRINR